MLYYILVKRRQHFMWIWLPRVPKYLNKNAVADLIIQYKYALFSLHKFEVNLIFRITVFKQHEKIKRYKAYKWYKVEFQQN